MNNCYFFPTDPHTSEVERLQYADETGLKLGTYRCMCNVNLVLVNDHTDTKAGQVL